MRLTVLANSQRYLSRLGTGTSYLLEADDARFVVDAASGTSQALRSRTGERPYDAVVVTHFHADQVHDLLPVVQGLRQGGVLYLPAGARKRFEQLLDALAVPDRALAHVRLFERGSGDRDVAFGVDVAWGPADHGCAGASVRFAAHGRTLAHLGDTGPVEGVEEFARGADAVVAHTILLQGQDESAARTNLTAAEAGRIARAAGARRLFLAHLPFYPDVAASLAEARDAFGGEVVSVEEGRTYGV